MHNSWQKKWVAGYPIGMSATHSLDCKASEWEANGELSLDRTLKAALFCLGRQDVQDVSFPMAREEKILQALEDLSLRGAVLPPLKRATPQALAARSSSSTQDMDTYIACW
jgi:hypothetical protein